MSKHHERQIARIFRAALNIVQRDGFSQLTMFSVAEEAGLTRQTIYNYFPDVEAILSGAVDQHMQAMETHLLALIDAQDGFESKLLSVSEFLFTVATADHQKVSLELGLSADQRQRTTQQVNSIKSRLLASWSNSYPASVAEDPINPRALIDILWGMIEGAAEASKHHPADKDELLALVNQVLKYALTNAQGQFTPTVVAT